MKRFFLISVIIFVMGSSGFSDSSIKRPNVAGQFYTADPQQLSSEIRSFLEAVPPSDLSRHVDIVIVPHAGYLYSGRIAAHAFKHVEGTPYRTVVVLAPSHHFRFSGVSVWAKGGYETPLGILPVDEQFAGQLIEKNPLCVFDPKVFEREHSLEVELPFIQELLPGVRIVPLLMGQPGLEGSRAIAQALQEVIGSRDDVLVVVSSDMSHFYSADKAMEMDTRAIALIEGMDAAAFWTASFERTVELCGFIPVTTALFLADLRGLAVEHLSYGHSGDITGDRKSVVGYGAFVLYHKDHGQTAAHVSQAEDLESGGVLRPLNAVQKKRLLDIARQTVDVYIREKKILDVTETDPRLKQREGAFVTLHKHGNLRGCIGHIIGQQPLYLTVRDMTIAACSQDPRFSPVAVSELTDIEVEVSVLSKPRRAESIEEIEMGVHGVIARRGRNQGVFLPQVADETGWDRETFLSYLCQHKAGLPADAWKDSRTELEIFTADVFSEKDPLDFPARE